MSEITDLPDAACPPIGRYEATVSAYLALAAKLTKQLSAGLAVVDARCSKRSDSATSLSKPHASSASWRPT
jgi:hypothetical protein